MIPTWAGQYIGLEFEEHGRGPKHFDCWGLVRHILAREFGRTLPDFGDGYQSTRNGSEVAASFRAGLTEWHPVVAPRLGDIVVLNIGGKPWHVGLVLDIRHMLHIEREVQSCIARYDQLPWKTRIEGFYAYQ